MGRDTQREDRIAAAEARRVRQRLEQDPETDLRVEAILREIHETIEVPGSARRETWKRSVADRLGIDTKTRLGAAVLEAIARLHPHGYDPGSSPKSAMWAAINLARERRWESPSTEDARHRVLALAVVSGFVLFAPDLLRSLRKELVDHARSQAETLPAGPVRALALAVLSGSAPKDPAGELAAVLGIEPQEGPEPVAQAKTDEQKPEAEPSLEEIARRVYEAALSDPTAKKAEIARRVGINAKRLRPGSALEKSYHHGREVGGREKLGPLAEKLWKRKLGGDSLRQV